MKLRLLVVLAAVLGVGIIGAQPAAASHENDLDHWGHGYVPRVYGPPSISHYAYEAEQTWIRSGFRQGFEVGPFSMTNGSCAPIDGGIVYCTASRAELGGHIGDAQVFSTTNPFRHIDYAVIRVCHDCGLTHSRAHAVVTHELGHALGLGHNPSRASVMHSHARSSQPDAHDRDAMGAMYRGHFEG